MTTKRYQIIWDRHWHWQLDPFWGRLGPLPLGGPHEGHIYEWRVWFGPLEIRKLGRAHNR